MWIHEVLVDIKVHYSKHSDVVSEYMKAFRHAVLLRRINLFRPPSTVHQRTRLDIDNMTSELFARPNGLGRDVDDTGATGDFKDTPITKRKRNDFEANRKNSRSFAESAGRR